MKVVNLNRDGQVIEDMSKVIIKHDEMPEVWRVVALIAEHMAEKWVPASST